MHAPRTASHTACLSCIGRKRFRLLDPSDAKRCLGTQPTPGASYPSTFDIDAFAPDVALPEGCKWWEGELGPGEIIFIPEEWPHAVLNMEDIIAVSYNFVDDWPAGAYAPPTARRHAEPSPARVCAGHARLLAHSSAARRPARFGWPQVP